MYIFSVDESSGRVTHSCCVSKSLIEKGLKANEWAKTVSETVGGKVIVCFFLICDFITCINI